ncbi:hypothetical protein AWJ19_21295 [Paenibacillus sp. DMB5]|nr:hypothetical protein AWJ19_21295 [Paenibacillus sp. DMB5]
MNLSVRFFFRLGYGDSFLVHTHERADDDDEDFVYLETQIYPIRDHWSWGATIYEQINLELLTNSRKGSCQTVITSYGDYSKDQIQEVAEIYLVKYNLTSVLFYNNYDQ